MFLSFFISCPYAKTPQALQALHDWLSSLLVSISKGCTKEFQSIAGHLHNNLWGKLDEDGLKNLCVVHMDQVNLSLLPCLHAVITCLVSQGKARLLPAWQESSLL